MGGELAKRLHREEVRRINWGKSILHWLGNKSGLAGMKQKRHFLKSLDTTRAKGPKRSQNGLHQPEGGRRLKGVLEAAGKGKARLDGA